VSPRPRPAVQVARYALDGAVLPLVTDTLPVAEAARRALMGIYGRQGWRRLHGNAPSPKDPAGRPRSPVFSGKDEAGAALKGHRHAYYLPTDEDGDGRLDHLTIYATMGFGDDDRRALDGLRKLRTGRDCENRLPLRLLLLGMGTLDEYHPGPLGEARVWESATPYLAARHFKTRGRDRVDPGDPVAVARFLEADLRAQVSAVREDLVEFGLAAMKIEPVRDGQGAFRVRDRWRPIQFHRVRSKPGDDGGRRPAGAFRLTFDRPVRGPLALGWSSHFGMGLFVPAVFTSMLGSTGRGL
jgi:CRISPR-associated protein Csb2